MPRAHFWEPLDAETARLMDGVLARLKDAGAVLVEADIPDVARLDNEAGFPIALYETVVDLNAYLAEHGSALTYPELVAQCASPDVAGLLQSLHGEARSPRRRIARRSTCCGRSCRPRTAITSAATTSPRSCSRRRRCRPRRSARTRRC